MRTVLDSFSGKAGDNKSHHRWTWTWNYKRFYKWLCTKGVIRTDKGDKRR